jgi:radical SAM superfamily enzyme YgiQ (UPF0313 family)
MAHGADMIGISVNSAPHTKYALAMAKALKRRQGDLKIFAGGQQATFLTEELLGPGDFGAVIRGEGEQAIVDIVKAEGFGGIAGVSWRNNGTIHNEPDRPLVEDLDTILPPARDLLPDRSSYRLGEYRVEGIESSRGCAFHCSFCSIRNFHRGRWRTKSVGRIMQEVDYILAHYPERKVIYFADDNFSTDIKRVKALCLAIIERKSDAYFWCQSRADILAKNPDVIELMGQAKFTAVLMGIETPVKRLLKSSRKGTSVEQIHDAIRLLHAQDIGVWGTFTLGLPGETLEEAKETGAFIPTTGVDVAQITVATPIPGSTLYTDAKANGDIGEIDWDKFDFTSPTMKGQLSKKQLDAIMHKAYLKVYLGRRFLKSLFTKKTNLDRLRRAMFGVFGSWIAYLVRERLAGLVGIRHRQAGGRGR